jgi:hypothetical protein
MQYRFVKTPPITINDLWFLSRQPLNKSASILRSSNVMETGVDHSTNLELPYIMPSQAQKHVTHNEAVGMLDALVQLAVVSRNLAAPPAAPADGGRYIVAPLASGAWSGHSGEVAHRLDGAWTFYPPKTGFLCHVAEEDRFVFWNGSEWSDLADAVFGALQNLSLIGIGTEADAANPFAAKLNKALWTARTTAEGGDGDLRCTLNKEGPADTLSLLMQTGYSGRAEFGLSGSDDFSIKVSPDGANWTTAFSIDRTTGMTMLAGNLSVVRPAAAEQKVISENAYAQTVLESYRTSTATHCNFVGHAAYGTAAAPEFIGAANVSMFELSSRPWNGGDFSQQARLGFLSAEAHSAGSLGVDCVVSCTPAGSTVRQDVLRVSASTGLSMFGANPVIDANRHLQLRSYTIATLPPASTPGQMIFCSDLGGGGGQLVSDGARWQRVSAGQQTITTDANATLTPLANAEEQRHTATLTASRTITLSTTNAYPGARFRLARSGGGAFALSIGGLKSVATNSWAEAVYNGTSWYISAYGAL